MYGSLARSIQLNDHPDVLRTSAVAIAAVDGSKYPKTEVAESVSEGLLLWYRSKRVRSVFVWSNGVGGGVAIYNGLRRPERG